MPIAERVTGHTHPLIAALAADPSGADAFWARMAAEKTPLIEPDPANPGHSLVTYVYPMPEGAQWVVIGAGAGEPPQNVMDMLAGTNVLHATYRYRNDVRATYGFVLDGPLIDQATVTQAEWDAFLERMMTTQPLPDPTARETWTSRRTGGVPDEVGSVVSLPDAAPQPFVQRRADVARGHIERADAFKSETLGNERRVWVYTPAGYDADRSEPYPLLVAFDGGASLTNTPIHVTLDNLIAEARIRPMVAVFVDNPTPSSRNDELPCSEPFARFMESELIPWLRASHNVSHDPADAYVTGVSYGGLASMWMGFRLPHLFGNILAQAPSLWWGPGFDIAKPRRSQSYPGGWLIDQYAQADKLPLRIWQEIGLMEHADLMIEPNRRMKAVLEAKGYDLTYSEPPGAHDYALWRGTIADALQAMAPAVAR
ncbi:MAG TPA: alpha/beta hydrolase-fold protein [Caulobacteraceae bacterium]|nr:alpha/beta hydrolase-fold protein [Caulobacteraceae bacterium]